MLHLETARATLLVWGTQLPVLLLSPGPFWSSPSTSVQVVPLTPGTSQSFCAPSSWCYCQQDLAHLSQLFPSARSQPQSTSAGWRSAHFSSCIYGLICLACCYDWKKTYSNLLLNKKGAIPQSNNTLLQVHFYITFVQKYSFLFSVRDFDTGLFEKYTVKVLQIMRASSLGSTKFSSIWILDYLWKHGNNVSFLFFFLFFSHVNLCFEIREDTFVIPWVYCCE